MAYIRAWTILGVDERRARETLGGIVSTLTGQKRRQLLVEHGWLGLFWGVAVSTLVVLTLKLAAPGYLSPTVVASIIGLALAAAACKAWMDRPDELQVAILADVELKLKQCLSTAWEFATRDGDPALVQRLAVQAVKQRYPSQSQAVFPLRINTWGALVPVAALALILVSVVDLERLPGPAPPVIDDVVVEEGVRLREFARQMQSRAAREGLPRATSESENIRRLGARMESGSLSRGQALNRLQKLGEALASQRQAALTEAGAGDAGPTDTFARIGSSDADASRLRDMLEQLLQGRLAPDEIESLGRESEALTRMGITAQELREARENFAAGEPLSLQQMVEELSRKELALEDARELGRALERVEQVRENLGDLIVRPKELAQPVQTAEAGRDDGDPHAEGGVLRQDAGEEYGAMVQERLSDYGSGSSPRERAQTLDPESERENIVLKPRSEFREGAGFTAETRVLPRAGRPNVEAAQLDVRFAVQMEEVLSKEQYPLHHKDFIRRYFLALSQGVANEASASKEPP